ncbi:hypothetical protein PMI14_01414, partial [Acidovorax sp. CF316]|uniref:hypothetical protein n=1 Tax=Acidovorax sp. CF316 TaxID=1144317 RepID=UPI00026BCF10
DGQDLVDLAFGIAQLERSASAPSGLERPNGRAPSAPYLPIQMSRGAGDDNAGAAPKKGPLGTKDNPRPIPFKEEDLKVRMSKDNPYADDIALLVGEEYVGFANIEDDEKNGPSLNISKTAKIESSGEFVKIDAHGVTEAMLRKLISYYLETKGHLPVGLPGKLANSNLRNFQKEFDKHRKNNQNGTKDDWAQAAIRDISFGKARHRLGYGIFEITPKDPIDVDELKEVPSKLNIIAKQK